MGPYQLVGGSLLLQLSPADVANPGKLYQALMMLLGNLNTLERKMALCINLNQELHGSTAARPTAAQLAVLPGGGIGWSMLDQTIGKPIWWNGSGWIDAAGVAA